MDKSGARHPSALGTPRLVLGARRMERWVYNPAAGELLARRMERWVNHPEAGELGATRCNAG